MIRRFDLWVPGIPATKGSVDAVPGRGRLAGRAVIVPNNSAKLKAWARRVSVLVDAKLRRGDEELPLFGRRNRRGKLERVAVRLTFLLPRPKSVHRDDHPTGRKDDIDKLGRAVLDAIDSERAKVGRKRPIVIPRVLRDDGQVMDFHPTKDYAEDGAEPGVRIEAWSLEQQQEIGLAPGREDTDR